MKYNQPYDQPANPNAAYIDGNPAAGIQGSIVPAASIEYPQRELVNLTLDTGLVAPDNADLHQLGKSVQAGRVNYAIDQGVPNAMAVGIVPPLVSYHDGFRIFVKAAHRNTGRTTLAVGALGTREVVRRDFTFLKDGDILPGAIHEMAYDSSINKWQLLSLATGGALPFLTQNLVLYVNWNIGNDANDGTAPDAQHALKTIQRAIDIAFAYPPSQFTITVFVADSLSYPEFVTPHWVGPNISIIGNTSSPQNVRVTGNNTHACYLRGINTMTIQGLTATTTLNAAGPGGCFVAATMAQLYVSNCRSLYCAGAVFEGFQANVVVGPGNRFAGNCGMIFWAIMNGSLGWQDGGINLTVETAMSVLTATTLCQQGGSMAVPGTPTPPIWVNPGNVTGKRYLVQTNGTVNTGAAGVNYFPGTIAGSTETGGQYI
jgi:hypothetical protein